MDEHIRDLERRIQTGDLRVYPTLLSEYLRVGYLMRTPIELAARYGNEAAIQVVGKVSNNKHDEIEQDFFYRQLAHSSWVREFFIRRGYALAEILLDFWDAVPAPEKFQPFLENGALIDIGQTRYIFSNAPRIILEEIKDWIQSYHTFDTKKDPVGPIHNGFIARLNNLQTAHHLFNPTPHLPDGVEAKLRYFYDLLMALCVVIIRESWWIIGGRQDQPTNFTSITNGWGPLHTIFFENHALNVFRKGDESNAYVQTLLELKIGVRLDNWLLRPYTNYHGLQNVPPD